MPVRRPHLEDHHHHDDGDDDGGAADDAGDEDVALHLGRPLVARKGGVGEVDADVEQGLRLLLLRLAVVQHRYLQPVEGRVAVLYVAA